MLIGEEGFCANVKCRNDLVQWQVQFDKQRRAASLVAVENEYGSGETTKKITSLSQAALPSSILKQPKRGGKGGESTRARTA